MPIPIDEARRYAGRLRNVHFETARAQDYPETGFALVTLFDARREMVDPVGGVRHIARSLGLDGKVMLVEPQAGDELKDNLHPVGRIFHAASTNFCVPASLAQEVGWRAGRAGAARSGPARRGPGAGTPGSRNPVQHILEVGQ